MTRTALGTGAFEGFGILDDGTTYLDGDDSGFGPKNGGPGDFVLQVHPGQPVHRQRARSPTSSQSPYAVGRGLRPAGRPRHQLRPGPRVRLRAVDPAAARRRSRTSRPQGLAAGLTGYYRPEDADLDPIALQPGQRAGVQPRHRRRDQPPLRRGRSASPTAPSRRPRPTPPCPRSSRSCSAAPARASTCPTTSRSSRAPATSILHEDAETTFEFPHNNDLWDCLPDGAGPGPAVRRLRPHRHAERPDGGVDRRHLRRHRQHFYVSIQHNISGQATILEITGWK